MQQMWAVSCWGRANVRAVQLDSRRTLPLKEEMFFPTYV